MIVGCASGGCKVLFQSDYKQDYTEVDVGALVEGETYLFVGSGTDARKTRMSCEFTYTGNTYLSHTPLILHNGSSYIEYKLMYGNNKIYTTLNGRSKKTACAIFKILKTTT